MNRSQLGAFVDGKAIFGGRAFAFVGLERIGGVVVYDLADPERPRLLGYVHDRNFEAEPSSPEAGHLGPEGVHFVPAADGPNGRPLLVVCNEVSGTTAIYEVAL